MDTVSIRVPYKNLKHDADVSGVEMVKFEEEALRRIESNKPNIFPYVNATNSSSPSQGSPTKNCNLITLILSCTVAAGVQFGWALQLSLLTPYIQVSYLRPCVLSFCLYGRFTFWRRDICFYLRKYLNPVVTYIDGIGCKNLSVWLSNTGNRTCIRLIYLTLWPYYRSSGTALPIY
ncbi:hypothetical protein L1987_72868 [Smallanthus sonchifolius]|uniref:Uncharacterized protein n=1 Tax=Smallanthus sonchifolius TaxID=185202 RepID=A0ACB9AX33_9ASTR|nr:hypothetical protein L1987_72868 [Smallanthus sonchifolius]